MRGLRRQQPQERETCPRQPSNRGQPTAASLQGTPTSKQTPQRHTCWQPCPHLTAPPQGSCQRSTGRCLRSAAATPRMPSTSACSGTSCQWRSGGALQGCRFCGHCCHEGLRSKHLRTSTGSWPHPPEVAQEERYWAHKRDGAQAPAPLQAVAYGQQLHKQASFRQAPRSQSRACVRSLWWSPQGSRSGRRRWQAVTQP